MGHRDRQQYRRAKKAAKVGVVAVLAVMAAGAAWSQTKCACGANPPGPRPERTATPYAGEPDDLRPFSRFTEPYYKNYLYTNVYNGAARDVAEPDMKSLTEVRIGFLGPLGDNPDAMFGQRMLHGAQMAIDEANARGGYGGKPFKLMLHDDYDNWQAKAAYAEKRPTDAAIWGAASNEVVKMRYDDEDWAILGSISSESTHIALRVALRAEIPIVNSASTDPTIPETYIPWYFTDIQDDRVQCLTLARRIYSEVGLKRIAILRVNNRYGRFGVSKFKDASRRLGHPVVIEQKYMAGTTDYRHELKVIQESRVDGIVLWTDEEQAAGIVKQMHELGMKQRVFGSYRVIGDNFLRLAGTAAEGVEAVFPYDPTRKDAKWVEFNARFEKKYGEKPDQFASLAYDAMNVLLDSMCKAGLNRARIQDALSRVETWDGVTGKMVFDPNSKNVAPMYLGTVKGGAITYRRATMLKAAAVAETPGTAPVPATVAAPGATSAPVPVAATRGVTPYARVGEDGVTYAGPALPDARELRIVVFGRGADAAVKGAGVQALVENARRQGQAISLVAIAADGQWGKSSTQLVDAIFAQHAVAMIALDRDSSHFAEQLAVKAFLPVIALSEDRTLTSTNIPWIFRLPAAGSAAAADGLPSSADARLGQALRCLAEAADRVGVNPEKIRDLMASGKDVAGLRFRETGELR
jgi:branched-chain amino acid transport system substrate-binding protein